MIIVISILSYPTVMLIRYGVFDSLLVAKNALYWKYLLLGVKVIFKFTGEVPKYVNDVLSGPTNLSSLQLASSQLLTWKVMFVPIWVTLFQLMFFQFELLFASNTLLV